MTYCNQTNLEATIIVRGQNLSGLQLLRCSRILGGVTVRRFELLSSAVRSQQKLGFMCLLAVCMKRLCQVKTSRESLSKTSIC